MADKALVNGATTAEKPGGEAASEGHSKGDANPQADAKSQPETVVKDDAKTADQAAGDAPKQAESATVASVTGTTNADAKSEPSTEALPVDPSPAAQPAATETASVVADAPSEAVSVSGQPAAVDGPPQAAADGAANEAKQSADENSATVPAAAVEAVEAVETVEGSDTRSSVDPPSIEAVSAAKAPEEASTTVVTDAVVIDTPAEPTENLKSSPENVVQAPGADVPVKDDVSSTNNSDGEKSAVVADESVVVKSEAETVAETVTENGVTDLKPEEPAKAVDGQLTEAPTVMEQGGQSDVVKEPTEKSETVVRDAVPQADVTDGPSKLIQNGTASHPVPEAKKEQPSPSGAPSVAPSGAPSGAPSNRPTPAPAKGSAVFQSAQPIGGKSLPPWMQTGKVAPSSEAGGPVKMVGSHEDTAEQVKESEQEYRKQFSDRKKFFKQQMEEQGTIPIKVAPPPAAYRDKAPVAEPVLETPVVLSPVQVPPQLRQNAPLAQPQQPHASFNPSPVKPVNGGSSQPGPKGGVGLPGLTPQQPNGFLEGLTPQTSGGGPTPFPSPQTGNSPSSGTAMWTPPAQSGSDLQGPPKFPPSNPPALGQSPPALGQGPPALGQGYSQSGSHNFVPVEENQYKPLPPLSNGQYSTGDHAPLPDLTDIINTATGQPIGEKKHFADSSFYSDRNGLFPTFEEQVNLCLDISSSLTSEDNQKSLGARMFSRRKQNSKKWVAKPGENGHGEWCSDDEGGEAEEEKKPAGPPPMKYFKSPKGVDDAQSLMAKDPEVKIFDEISPRSIAAVAEGLTNTSGRGVDLFQKRKMKSEEWVVDESNVQKAPPAPVVELTKTNKLNEILNSPAVLYVQSPWEAAMSSPSGSCEKAFQEVRRSELANAPAQSLLSRTPSPMFGNNNPLATFAQQPSPHSASPVPPPPSDAFSRLPRGWGASSPTAPAQKPFEPAPVFEPQRFLQQPPSPSPKPVMAAPIFKPQTPEPIQNYKPFVPTPIYQPPVPQQQPQNVAPAVPPQPVYQPAPQPAYVPPPVQPQPQFNPQPAYQPQWTPPPPNQPLRFPPLPQPQYAPPSPTPSFRRAQSVAPPLEQRDIQQDADVPYYQPAPQTVVRRYSQQFDNYSPQYRPQQPQQFAPAQTYQQNLYQQQQHSRVATSRGARQYEQTHRQWERPPEPRSSNIRQRSRSQPPAPFAGRQGYAPSMPSPNYGGSSPQHSSPTPKWGSNMTNWTTPQPFSLDRRPSPQPKQQRPLSGSWGSDMHNWAPKEQPPYQQVHRPAQRPQSQNPSGMHMGLRHEQLAPTPARYPAVPARFAATSTEPGVLGPNMNNWGPSKQQSFAPQQQQALRFPPLQQTTEASGVPILACTGNFELRHPTKQPEQVNTVHRAGPPNVDRLFSSNSGDIQQDADVPYYQPAPQTVVRRYSQQFDNYSPQYRPQQPQQFAPAQTYQQNLYQQQQQQPSRHVTWSPVLKQTHTLTPQSTDEFKRQYEQTHRQWERPPEPRSSNIRQRSRSQPPAPFAGRQGYAPSMPSPNYGGSSPQHSSPTPKWGSNMNNWTTPQPFSLDRRPSPQPKQQRPLSGSWGSDMHNWAPKEQPPYQQVHRPAQRPQSQNPSGTWGSDMNNWRPRQPATPQYRPASQPHQQSQGSWGPNMNNWGPSKQQSFAPQQQQALRFPPLQQQQKPAGVPILACTGNFELRHPTKQPVAAGQATVISNSNPRMPPSLGGNRRGMSEVVEAAVASQFRTCNTIVLLHYHVSRFGVDEGQLERTTDAVLRAAKGIRIDTFPGPDRVLMRVVKKKDVCNVIAVIGTIMLRWSYTPFIYIRDCQRCIWKTVFQSPPA
ncbi:hypothetical protein BV898_06439 [Hypsibius exemplaris]|uniref:Uncharacterized protein n=1 Tax=Hypsibius exemplaris TaxID=2072580 RepID=A0A1W0WW70_HYPEX|nr:hypothetical protein BV898_06439 [Hypsibius exemplaris]